MSPQATSWAYEQPVTLASRKFVLVTIANFADAFGVCRYSQEQIADLTGQSRRSIVTHLAELEAEGFIERVERHAEDGSREVDEIRLCMPPLVTKLTAKPSATLAPTPREKVAHDPVQELHVPRAEVAHDTRSPRAKVAQPIKDLSSLPEEESSTPNTNNTRPEHYSVTLKRQGLLGVWGRWVEGLEAGTTQQDAMGAEWVKLAENGRALELEAEADRILADLTSFKYPMSVLRTRLTKPSEGRAHTSAASTRDGSAAPTDDVSAKFQPGVRIKWPDGEEATVLRRRASCIDTDHPKRDTVPFGRLKTLEVLT